MKTIAFKDNAGGRLTAYWSKEVSEMKKNDRLVNGLEELKRMANITIYLVNGNKQKKLFRKGW